MTGRRPETGPVSGSAAQGQPVVFVGSAMVPIVQAVDVVAERIGQPPVVIGGLAVMCRLTREHRATLDLDVVELQQPGRNSQLQILRLSDGAEPAEPDAAFVPTASGPVRVDVLVVRQDEIDHPSDDPGDRLHASSHAWALATASPVTMSVVGARGETVAMATTLVAEAGPLVAMKLQSIMDRGNEKAGTDLLDIVRLLQDYATRAKALEQLTMCGSQLAADIAVHTELWFRDRQHQSLDRILAVGGERVNLDDLELVFELLTDATGR